MHAQQALAATELLGFVSVLDIGSGDGLHAARFRSLGKQVTTISLCPPADYVGDYLDIELGQHDLVWACHVLEHQRNPGLFLEKCFDDCRQWFCVTVPPLKHEIVGGHVSLWNAGLLIYHLILAGWDCSQARVMQYGYNISLLVEKKRAVLPSLKMDYGDIDALKEFFPMPVVHGFNGDIYEIGDSMR